MYKLFGLLLLLNVCNAAFSQNVKISIHAPAALNNRKAILLTREKGFAAIVHSIKLGFDTTRLQMDPNLLPDLYQLQISNMKGALTFFFEPGTQILLDTLNLGKSPVSHSKSNREWLMYRESIQLPSDQRANAYVTEEARARKKSNADSVQYWISMQAQERQFLLDQTEAFIVENPRSYVSLYLLKMYWYAFKSKGLFEKISPSISHHRNYQFLKTSQRTLVKAK